jgi:transcription-repair coupling factor (superfamily II helicase)
MNQAGQKLVEAFGEGVPLKQLLKATKSALTVGVERLTAGAFPVCVAAAVQNVGGIHLLVMDDRDNAAYLANDLYELVGQQVEVLFFPTAYKRSIQYGQQDASGIVQRTAVLNAIRSFGGNGALVVCTYPEALSEKVVSRVEMTEKTLTLSVGEEVSMSTVEDMLVDWGFDRVDFVYEPGQYSIRGGIMDIFSYTAPRPYRVDFFGDEIESIRIFEISSQLSAEKVTSMEILPNLKSGREQVTSFAGFAGGATWWFDDLGHTLSRVDALRKKLLAELDEPAEIGSMVTSGKELLADIAERLVIVREGSTKREIEATVEFHTSPQPEFNKQFDLLAANIADNTAKGYETYILSENKAQVERLTNIFASIHASVTFRAMSLTLHEGFVDNDLRLCLYTDHQIFDRYHRYKIRGEINRDEALTVAELNELKVGDYVVHIDHGVGKFGGLVKTEENGKTIDAVKLVYKDNDVLLVNIHNLHRIARYKSGDAEPPRVYKLGSGAWQRMKAATKSAVKNIARELIALYARRKASGGFAFSPDTYLQQELEASFEFEDTPDQEKATELIKSDMESPEPMDRLVCGDVGFGKTEVAIRAAFKAVADSKQVAVLVPTTILSLQHYRTFSERLRGFPVNIEFLNRSKSAKETRQILDDVAAGKIDILIGTHKILGKGVQFKDLGLLVIDEEQKFGVSSKEKLRQMSASVDTLTLTATPIPRTLQFSLMGSRDLSIINTPPPNRQPIATESHLFSEELIKEAVEEELSRGGQVYFVHNRVEDISRIAALVERLVPKARVAVMHGQMEPKVVERLIMDFIYNEFDVLVATSIIENGIDIPNANTIIINNAQNFGLSDLHQLRGRVGRSNRKGYCYLLTPPEELLTGDARRRLRAIEEFSDLGAGFNIAMQDLDIRGAGNLFGAEQSGFIADIGFETYQKILNEAVAELRAEGVEGADKLMGEGDNNGAVRYIEDTHIETGQEAGIPDSYVGQNAEKLKLYRLLDTMTDEASMQKLAAELTDRFGQLPAETQVLMDVVRLRWLAIPLGFERVKVKNGLMILGFPADGQSAYYQSDTFNGILQFIMKEKDKFVLRQNNNKLGLTVRGVKDVHEALEVLRRITKFIEDTK